MAKYITFNKYYFLLTVILFIIEAWIGSYMHDWLIRPYGGDFLIVILMYCFVKSFVETPVLPTAIGVLLFAYAIEVSQYFHLVRLLGLEYSKVARALLGTSFSFMDLVSYTLGIATIIVLENLKISLNRF